MFRTALTLFLSSIILTSYAVTTPAESASVTITAESVAQNKIESLVVQNKMTPLAASTLAASNTATSPVLVNKIIAYVNKRIITQNELNKQIDLARQNLLERGIKNTDQNDLRSRVIEQLILQQIQLDLAARSGIKTSDSEINDAILNVEKSQKVTEAQLRDKLTRQGLSYDDFRQQISDQITVEKLKQREVDGRVSINDDEVTRILNSETYKNKVDYRLSDIVISIPEQATQEAVVQRQALAEQVRAQLMQGKSFDQMAIKYSSAPNALNGGDLGWKSNSSLPPLILNQISPLAKDGITQVIKLPIGFFIFKVNDIKQHGTPQIVKQYHVRHILVKVNELTSDDEAHQKIVGLREKIMKEANNPTAESQEFVALAKQYSEDASSIKGGDIGWISKGDTVATFEQAVFNTPVGQLSQPIKSPFGWHILQVIETRESNLANDKEKAEIRQELRDSKAQMLYTEWVRNVREMAYVKLNDD